MSLRPSTPPAAPGGLPPPLEAVDLLVRFCAVVAALAAAVSVGASSLIVVSQVRVVGARDLSPAAVVSSSGVRVGQRLAEVDPDRIAQRLRRHPRIARASVEVSPSGRVVLRVEERVPHAAVPYHGGYLLVDREAVVVAHVRDPGVLPVVTVDGRSATWARSGDRIPLPGLAAATRIVDRLPPSELSRGVRVRITAEGDVVVTTADGFAVLLGPGAAAGQRVGVLPAALEAVRRWGAPPAVVDLRFGGSVYVRSGGVPP
jgi:cell division septal protein FtsQ